MSACEFAAQAVRMEIWERLQMRRASGTGVAGAAAAAQSTYAIFECGVKRPDSDKKYTGEAIFLFFLGQIAAWSRLVGHHRVRRRS